MKLSSVVTPCYNEEENIRAIHAQVFKRPLVVERERILKIVRELILP